ncbi:hypothetical protein MMC25_005015 [Agyrium rufum]|nr:hypothetical protein [Agyrium rufum]
MSRLMPAERSLPSQINGVDEIDNDSHLDADGKECDSESLPEKETPIDVECDTCFGMITATASSSFGGIQRGTAMPVDIKSRGDLILLYSQDSQAYVGFLNLPVLSELQSFTINLTATLLVGNRAKALPSKKVKSDIPKEYKVQIVVHGIGDDGPAIGAMLSNAEVFLQHPTATQCARSTNYTNPHYLIRPGSRMPDLTTLQITSNFDESEHGPSLDEVNKARLLRVFDCADIAPINLSTSIKPSRRLKSTLMDHQLIGLAMMIEKECGIVQRPRFPALWVPVNDELPPTRYRNTVTGIVRNRPMLARGGVLADEMGLEKTLSVLGLICSSLDQMDSVQLEGTPTHNQGTLIIAPMSAITAWQRQVVDHIITEEALAAELQKHHLILTTYETLRSEWETECPLFRTKWLRVDLDEAHHIRNRFSKKFDAAYVIRARYRWCLTGTPIHNSLDDYRALLAFLGIEPFQDKSQFDYWIASSIKEEKPGSLERLQVLVKVTCLRRTKQSSSAVLDLLPLLEKVDYIRLHDEELEIYNFFKERIADITSRVQPKQTRGRKSAHTPGKTGTGKEDNILALMKTLQLICNHGEALFPASALTIWKSYKSNQPAWALIEELQITCYACGEQLEGNSIGTSQTRLPPVNDRQTLCTACSLSNEGSTETEIPLEMSPDAQYLQAQSYCISRQKPSAKLSRLLHNLSAEEISMKYAKPVKR